MNAFDAIRQQVYDARLQDREVLHLRVTRQALPGSIVALPLTPERARALRTLWAVRQGDMSVTALPDLEVLERYVEVVMHPDDYLDLLGVAHTVNVDVRSGVQRVLGYPITMEAV